MNLIEAPVYFTSVASLYSRALVQVTVPAVHMISSLSFAVVELISVVVYELRLLAFFIHLTSSLCCKLISVPVALPAVH